MFSAGTIVSVRELGDRWGTSVKETYATVSINNFDNIPAMGEYELTSTSGDFIGPRELGQRRVIATTGADTMIDEEELFLQVPPTVSRRVRDLAASLTRGQRTVEEKVRAVEGYLSLDFRYTQQNLNSGTRRPLDYFLFESRAGHCEYFATAMAILMRCAGVPARVVQGFAPGAIEERTCVVRMSDAHLWPEVFYPGQGWRAHEPTPAAERRTGIRRRLGPIDRLRLRWYTHVLGYDGAAQSDFARGVVAALGHAAERAAMLVARFAAPLRVALGVLLAVLVLRRKLSLLRGIGGLFADFARRHGGRTARVRSYFGQYLRAIARKDYTRHPGTTPNDLLSALDRDSVPIVSDARLLTDMFYRTRFGGAELSPDDEREARGAVGRIRDWAR